MRTLLGAAALATLLCAATGGPAARAAEAEALPAFRVTTPAAAPVPSSALSSRKQWLLVYVTPDCAPCSSLLAALKGWKTPNLMDRTVLVVGSDPDSARAALAGVLPRELSALPWYADGEGEAWQALGLSGAPVLLAVRDGRIAWRLSGVPSESQSLESLVRTWVEAPED